MAWREAGTLEAQSAGVVIATFVTATERRLAAILCEVSSQMSEKHGDFPTPRKEQPSHSYTCGDVNYKMCNICIKKTGRTKESQKLQCYQDLKIDCCKNRARILVLVRRKEQGNRDVVDDGGRSRRKYR